MNEGRKRRAPWDEIFLMNDWDVLQEEMREHMNRLYDEFLRGAESPGTKVYGYHMTVDRNGDRHVEEFGNVGPGLRMPDEIRRMPYQIAEEWDPFMDIIEKGGKINLLIEIPGVAHEDIDIRASGSSVEIRAKKGDRDLHKVVKLPCQVDPESSKARYHNGVLDVTFDRVSIEGWKEVQLD